MNVKASIEPGEEFGPYRVHERLGIGGMAVVHRAELVSPGGSSKVIALKRLLPQLTRETAFVRRFVDEARIGQRLRHSNIVKTYAVGRVEAAHFIALEYVRGPTLLQLLRRCDAIGPIPVRIGLHILIQVSRALAYAHGLREENGQPMRLIHRDIAPSNIIVSELGVTKLIDFGVAKAACSHVHTQAGAVIGKLGYVAPEYFRGRFDARVDLFSLGVVAYELLTATPLFEGANDLRSAELARARAIDPPSRTNPEIPPDLDDIVMTALQRDPDLRWQNAFALHTALLNFAYESGLTAHDRDVAEWISHSFRDLRCDAAPGPHERTSELELDIELAFAAARTRTARDVMPAAAT